MNGDSEKFFTSEPSNFDYDSPLSSLSYITRPRWGTCPSPGDIDSISSDDIDDSVYEIQFINENLGFATTTTKLLKTVDGGQNWIIAYSPTSNYPKISEVLFLNESVGYINSGGSLYKTINGGKFFLFAYRLNGAITDIYSNNGTLIVSSNDQYNNKISLYDGEYGASTYRVVDSNIITSNDEGETFEIFDFTDSNNANNANNNEENIRDSHGNFSLTVNDDVLFLDMGTTSKNWVVRFDLNTNDLEDFVYNDDRQSFLNSGMIVEIPPIRIKTYSVIENYIYAFGHAINSDQNNGFIYSTDNGKNWVNEPLIGNYDEITFFSSYFSSPNVGYIVGESGHFLKTTDGGNNWTKIDLGTYKNIHDIEKINDSTLILVGEDGFIYKYNM